MTRLRSFAALGALALLAACERNAVQVIAGPLDGASVRFYNFSVGGPNVNFYAGEMKVTGVGSTTGQESTSGTAYGSLGLAGLYSQLPAAQYAFSGRITATVDKGLAVASLNTTVENGRYYSFYMSGFYDAVAKTTDEFIVEDDFPGEIDYSTAYVRFVHAIGNAAPMTLYATNTVGGAVVAVGGLVAYQAAGDFVAVPAGTYNLGTRYDAGVVDIVTRTGVTFNNGRVYTISARGDITVGGTTAANRRFLDNTTNR